MNTEKYKLIEQPKNSWNENPCFDCCFGKEDGECHAPQDILDSDDECGFTWHGPAYIYQEI